MSTAPQKRTALTGVPPSPRAVPKVAVLPAAEAPIGGSGGTVTPEAWVVELPAGMRLLSLNDRIHWAVKGRITRDLRKAAWACARNARIPHLERAAIVVEYRPPLVTRRRDLDNVPAASGKPCIDGLVDAGVLSDDSSRYVEGILHLIGEPFPKGRLVLHVTDRGAAA